MCLNFDSVIGQWVYVKLPWPISFDWVRIGLTWYSTFSSLRLWSPSSLMSCMSPTMSLSFLPRPVLNFFSFEASAWMIGFGGKCWCLLCFYIVDVIIDVADVIDIVDVVHVVVIDIVFVDTINVSDVATSSSLICKLSLLLVIFSASGDFLQISRVT